ncbi:MAG TPA: hypothetical protein VLG11_01390 [Candidatus Saccharimonadales bacterium]|nr:hypothetical protein [Candidatus Saccharimonadales bacterium]
MANQVKKQEKDDAKELALLLYDLYKQRQSSGKIVIGQNDANDNKAD